MSKYCPLSYEDRKNIEDGLNQNKLISKLAVEIYIYINNLYKLFKSI